MSGLRFDVLGPLQVTVDGSVRVIPPGRRRAVLGCLVVNAGHAVSAEALIDAAWGTDLPQDPHRALRTVLSRLRAVIGAEVIETHRNGYLLATDRHCTDAAEFEELRERAAGLAPGPAAELLSKGLSLWRGPAYDECGDSGFATAAAARLDQHRADATEALAAARIQTGSVAASIDELADVLAEQPFRERCVELLARTLCLTGRRTEALEVLRSHRRRIAAELGLDPSPTLDFLEERILGRGLGPHSPVDDLPHWLDTSAAFIGREGSLAEVVDGVSSNRVTVITGPGGVGKSRLAAESLRLIHHQLGLPTVVAELRAVRPGEVPSAVAAALGLRGPNTATGDDVAEFLSAEPHLLVLDNCEHLLDEVSSLLTLIIGRAHDAHILATSRRRFGLPSELTLPLPPLDLADPRDGPSAQTTASAVRLFSDRLRRSRPSFSLGPTSIREVVSSADAATDCPWPSRSPHRGPRHRGTTRSSDSCLSTKPVQHRQH